MTRGMGLFLIKKKSLNIFYDESNDETRTELYVLYFHMNVDASACNMSTDVCSMIPNFEVLSTNSIPNCIHLLP